MYPELSISVSSISNPTVSNELYIVSMPRIDMSKDKLKGIPIQGGLDPKILLADNEKIKKSTENYLNIFKDYPYIFNLGHGVLPETKPETIEYIIKIIRNKN